MESWTKPETRESYLEDRSQRAQELYNKVHDCILQAQRRNAERQTSRRSALGKGGRKLAVGDLAYLLTKTEGFKTKVNGPFVVCALSERHVELRTSGAVHGQPVNQFKVHRDRVVRCTPVTDVLEDLLNHADVILSLIHISEPTRPY